MNEDRSEGSPGPLRRLGVLTLGLSSVMLFLVLGRIQPASAVVCDTSWTSAVSGDWSDSAKWTNGVPTSTKNACVTVNGTYIVTLKGSQGALGLTLGGSTGAQILLMAADLSGDAKLTLANQGASSDGVGARGTLELRSTGNIQRAVLDVTGVLTNNGTIRNDMAPSQGGGNFLFGDVVNNATVELGAHLFCSTDSDWTNNGTIEGAGSLQIAVGSFTQTQNAAALSVGFYLQQGGTFSFSGGTASGNDLLVNADVRPSGGSGTFTVSGNNPSPGAVLGSDVGAGVTLVVGDRTRIPTTGPTTNNGVIELEHCNGCPNAPTTLDFSAGPLTNNGTLRSLVGPGAANLLNGDLVNNGLLDIEGTARQEATGSDWTNTGTIDVAPTGVLELAGGSTQKVIQTGGSIANGGAFRQTGGLLTFSGGSAAGNPIEFTGLGLSPSGGTGSLILLGSAKLGSNIGSGIALRVEGRNTGAARLAVSTSFISAGLIDLASTDACCTASLTMSGAKLTNAGTIKASAGGHPERSITGSLDNAGLLQIDNLTRSASGSTWSNTGTIRVASGVLLDHGTGKLTNQSGSTLTGGTYEIAGTFEYGSANIGTNAASIVLDGAGAAIQNGTGANALAGFASNAAAGSLEFRNGASLTTPGALTNAGALAVGAGSSFQSTGSYTQSAGSTRVDGSLTASGSQVVLNGGSLSGNGTVAPALVNVAGTVAPGSSPGALTVNGPYTQGNAATLTIEVDGLTPGSEYDRLAVAGAAALGGTLQLQTGFVPSLGDGVIPLTSPSRTGTFKLIQGQFLSNPVDSGWLVGYNPTNITLSLVGTADLMTTKADSADPVHVGQSFFYTITVVNQSSRQAAGVKVTDTVKAPLVLDGTPTSTKGSCSVAGNPPKVTCQIGTLGPGESVTITIPVKGTAPGKAKDTAGAATKTLDSNPANNKDTETTKIKL